jgi:hypothetical protein
VTRWLTATTCALLALPAHATAQEAHAGAAGWVYETELRGVRDGALQLANGAALEASPALRLAEPGMAAVLIFLRSGCRVWIDGIGLTRCTAVAEPPADAPRTDAALVYVERVLDGGVTVILTGGTVLKVDEQAEFTNGWRRGEAIMIGETRLLHLDHGKEIVAFTRAR